MGWASAYISQLRAGSEVEFRPRGHSMSGRIENGQLVRVRPLKPGEVLGRRDVVLCTVKGNDYLHLILARSQDGRYLIGNNRGGENGWTRDIHGVLVSTG